MRMVLARGDWYFTVCALIVGAFMSVPYVYAVQQDNYRVAEVWKSRRVRGAYLADLLCILVFGGAWAGCWFLSSRMFWGFLASLFFCIAEVALYIVDEAPKRKKPLRYTRRAVRAMAAVSLVSGAAVTAAFNGEVMQVTYNRNLKSYIVLIGHGNYFTTYSNMATATVREGQKVSVGQTIGTVGRSVDSAGKTEYKLVFGIFSPNGETLPADEWLRH